MFEIEERIEKYKAASEEKKKLAEIFNRPKQQNFYDRLTTDAEELDCLVSWLEELLELRKKKTRGKKDLADK